MMKEYMHMMHMEKMRQARAEKVHKCVHGLGMVAFGVAVGMFVVPKVKKETCKGTMKETEDKAKTL